MARFRAGVESIAGTKRAANAGDDKQHTQVDDQPWQVLWEKVGGEEDGEVEIGKLLVELEAERAAKNIALEAERVALAKVAALEQRLRAVDGVGIEEGDPAV